MFVVPLDGSAFAEHALPVARSFASRVEGSLLLVTTHWDHDSHEPEAYIERIASEQHDVPVKTVVVHDRTAADAITLVAREDGDRGVCMTSHGRGGLRWAMLGSVAEDVVRRSERPVLLVGRHCATDPVARRGPVLLCVDGSASSEFVAPAAAAWADRLGLGLEVAVVVHPLDVPDAEHPEELLDPITERLAAHGVACAPAMLRAGYPAGALADHADSIGASMIAMTTRARRGAGRVALGSVSMGVLGSARCPVLVAHAPES
jgi:nucleotide-binding universal stress UspA family protein